MVITADTITDEQIRELRDSFGFSTTGDAERMRLVCGCALGEPGYHDHAKLAARARCAAALQNSIAWAEYAEKATK